MVAANSAGGKVPRVVFSHKETDTFLALISEMSTSSLLDSHWQGNQVHFQRLEGELRSLGFQSEWIQLRTHWKNLKSRY